ncbi:MAG: hypothetical protein D6781_09550 [Verrucomicrobia bacterium]|nr:MAG: hypothetical protein D6781_09550 [Verrucomicrobiota bacterium]
MPADVSISPASAQTKRAWGQTLLITLVAAGAFALLRWLPLSVDPLHYTDFHADGKSFLEFCEPGSPQFVPVDKVRSPVEMTVSTETRPQPGQPVRGVVRLATAGGKPVAAESLLVVHTEKLHLLVVDESLDEYHHLHPQPTGEPGAFAFAFTPKHAGVYRLFGDFTPRATGRALYAGAQLAVGDAPAEPAGVERRLWRRTVVDGYVFELRGETSPLRINEPAELTLRVSREDGAPVVLEEIMGAKAHMVGFDESRSGFAHLHPAEVAEAGAEGAQELAFTLLLTDPGYYRLWAQVMIDGRERYAPFGIAVDP